MWRGDGVGKEVEGKGVEGKAGGKPRKEKKEVTNEFFSESTKQRAG